MLNAYTRAIGSWCIKCTCCTFTILFTRICCSPLQVIVRHNPDQTACHSFLLHTISIFYGKVVEFKSNQQLKSDRPSMPRTTTALDLWLWYFGVRSKARWYQLHKLRLWVYLFQSNWKAAEYGASYQICYQHIVISHLKKPIFQAQSQKISDINSVENHIRPDKPDIPK